jgi:glycerol kinase
MEIKMTNAKYLLALDQGTTSSRCIIFSRGGETVSTAQKEFTQYYPHKGWVEHDANEIFDTQLKVAKDAMKLIGATPQDIAAIGITNQRETVVVWDKNTGKPICPAIVWQCRRTADYCDSFVANGLTDMIREKTGLVIDAYFSATKLKWILDNIPGSRERAKRGELLFGTVDSWLLWKLTNGQVHATDPSNASRTMLFNINTLTWDDDLLKLFDIPKEMMPEVLPSSGIFGYTSAFGGKVAISGIAGDQQAALFGQCCFEKGDVKNTYGTGGFMLMNTKDKPVLSKTGSLQLSLGALTARWIMLLRVQHLFAARQSNGYATVLDS